MIGDWDDLPIRGAFEYEVAEYCQVAIRGAFQSEFAEYCQVRVRVVRVVGFQNYERVWNVEERQSVENPSDRMMPMPMLEVVDVPAGPDMIGRLHQVTPTMMGVRREAWADHHKQDVPAPAGLHIIGGYPTMNVRADDHSDHDHDVLARNRQQTVVPGN